MTTLPNLLNQKKIAIELLEKSQGELTPEMELELASLEKSILEKADSYAHVSADLWFVVEDLKAKAKMFSEAAKQALAYAERFEKRAIANLTDNGLTELVGESFTLKCSPTKGSVQITDEAKAEELYGVQETVTKVPLDTIRMDLENGINLGCAIIKQNWSLKIKVNKGAKKK